MELQVAFQRYAEGTPDQHAALQHTSLALRRGGVSTLEELRELYRERPKELESLRGIGPSRMSLIGEVLGRTRAAKPGRDTQNIGMVKE